MKAKDEVEKEEEKSYDTWKTNAERTEEKIEPKAFLFPMSARGPQGDSYSKIPIVRLSKTKTRCAGVHL